MILSLMTKLDMRYLKATERNELKAFASTLRPRRAAYDEVRRKTNAIVDGLIIDMRKLYPDFAKIRPKGFEKGTRDMGLLTHIAANMMLFDSCDFHDHMFTEWYRTILKSVHISPQFLQDTFKCWHQHMEKNLTNDTYALLRPYTQHVSEYLTKVPVPHKDETGHRRAAK